MSSKLCSNLFDNRLLHSKRLSQNGISHRRRRPKKRLRRNPYSRELTIKRHGGSRRRLPHVILEMNQTHGYHEQLPCPHDLGEIPAVGRHEADEELAVGDENELGGAGVGVGPDKAGGAEDGAGHGDAESVESREGEDVDQSGVDGEGAAGGEVDGEFGGEEVVGGYGGGRFAGEAGD